MTTSSPPILNQVLTLARALPPDDQRRLIAELMPHVDTDVRRDTKWRSIVQSPGTLSSRAAAYRRMPYLVRLTARSYELDELEGLIADAAATGSAGRDSAEVLGDLRR